MGTCGKHWVSESFHAMCQILTKFLLFANKMTPSLCIPSCNHRFCCLQIHLSGILPAVFEPSMIIKYITLTLFLSKGDVYVLFFGILGGFWRLLWYPGGLLIVPANKVWPRWCRVTPEAGHKGSCSSYSVLWSTGYGGGRKSCKKSVILRAPRFLGRLSGVLVNSPLSVPS